MRAVFHIATVWTALIIGTAASGQQAAVPGQQASPPDDVRNAVVIVVARGVDTGQGNVPVEGRASGFFVNDEGVLITSYHLRGNLGAGVPEGTVNFTVHANAFAQGRPAKLLFASPETDIMILQVPVGPTDVKVLVPASKADARLKVASTPVYAAGYPSGYDYNVSAGTITSFTGPIKPVGVGWITSVSYPAGMSGSPVVVSDGRVVAVVKGADEGGTSLGVVVPVYHIPPQYWSSATPAANAGQQKLPEGARLLVSGTVVSDAPRPVVKSITRTRSPCDRNAEQVIAVQPASGWRVDPGSVVISMRSFIGKSVDSGVRTVAGRTEAFLTMEPQGTCQRIGDQEFAVGDGATFFGELRYVEVPLAPIARNSTLAIAASGLGKVPLPPGASDLKAVLELPDGTRQNLQVKAQDISGSAMMSTLKLDAVAARAKF
jgi:hypothetical protein